MSDEALFCASQRVLEIERRDGERERVKDTACVVGVRVLLRDGAIMEQDAMPAFKGELLPRKCVA